MITSLFVYGTLLDERVQRRVTGRTFASRAGRLRGYARLGIYGKPYPGIVARPGAVVEGRVLGPVGPAAMARLDAYEGPLYRRRRVRVELEGAKSVRAHVYLLKPGRRQRSTKRPWPA